MDNQGVPVVLMAEVVQDGEGEGVQVGWVGVIVGGCGSGGGRRVGDEGRQC